MLGKYPELIQLAGANRAPHTLVHFLRELAQTFHTWYNAEQFIVEDAQLRNARIALALAAQQVVRNGLDIAWSVSTGDHVSTGRQRMPARDYKNTRRSQPVFDFAQYRQFGAGLAVGLVLALFVWIHDRNAVPPTADNVTEGAGPDVVSDGPVAPGDPDDAADDYAFYKMLPNFEVAVPDRRSIKRRDQPVAPVVTPGAYVLQAGAYHDIAGAELQRDKLAKLNIEATILHVSDDTNLLHVVRIGPTRDLDRLNAMQKTLHDADIEVFVQRAGD